MLSAQLIAEKIKKEAEAKHKSITKMCRDLKISKNTVSNIASGTDVAYTCFAKIADYLECSVDYLLGRPSSVDTLSKDEQTVILAFRKLSPIEQGQVIGFAVGLSNKP